MVACANGDVEMARLLLASSAGVDVNLPIALTDSEIVEGKSTAATITTTKEELRCAGSGALVEAARVGSVVLAQLLFHNGAMDYDNKALALAVAVNIRACNQPSTVKDVIRQ